MLLRVGVGGVTAVGGHPQAMGFAGSPLFGLGRRPGTWYSASLSHVIAMGDPALNHHD